MKRRALGAGPASAGATSQASAAIGNAAVAHTASTVRREYCLIEGSMLLDAVLTDHVTVISTRRARSISSHVPRGEKCCSLTRQSAQSS